MNWQTVWLASTNAAPAEKKMTRNIREMIEMFSLVMGKNCLFHVTSSQRIEFNWGLTAERYFFVLVSIGSSLSATLFPGAREVDQWQTILEPSEDVLRHCSIDTSIKNDPEADSTVSWSFRQPLRDSAGERQWKGDLFYAVGLSLLIKEIDAREIKMARLLETVTFPVGLCSLFQGANFRSRKLCCNPSHCLRSLYLSSLSPQ